MEHLLLLLGIWLLALCVESARFHSFICSFIYLAVFGFELMALHLLGRCSITLATPPALKELVDS
jgi:hypothetical protein